MTLPLGKTLQWPDPMQYSISTIMEKWIAFSILSAITRSGTKEEIHKNTEGTQNVNLPESHP